MAQLATTLCAERALRVQVSFTDLEELERASDQLADILCWAAGYRAATPDNATNWPPVDGVRDLRDRLRKAITIARNAQKSE